MFLSANSNYIMTSYLDLFDLIKKMVFISYSLISN